MQAMRLVSNLQDVFAITGTCWTGLGRPYGLRLVAKKHVYSLNESTNKYCEKHIIIVFTTEESDSLVSLNSRSVTPCK